MGESLKDHNAQEFAKMVASHMPQAQLCEAHQDAITDIYTKIEESNGKAALAETAAKESKDGLKAHRGAHKTWLDLGLKLPAVILTVVTLLGALLVGLGIVLAG